MSEIFPVVLAALVVLLMIFQKRRRAKNIQSILSSLRPYNVLPALEMQRSLATWKQTSQALATRRHQTAVLLDMLHNARCLLTLVTAFEDVDEEDVRYISERMWGITACLATAFAESLVRIAYPGCPRISSLWATAAYGELWMRVKEMTFEMRPDLIPQLESIS